jgi:mono/diheme cytochrome c family protein
LKVPGFVSGHRTTDVADFSKSDAPSGVGFRLVILAVALFFPTLSPAQTAPPSYKAHCWACHGARGAGDTMLGRNMNLRPLGAPEAQNRSDDELFAIISKGKNRMPRYDRKLSKDQIHALVEYIRTLKQ